MSTTPPADAKAAPDAKAPADPKAPADSKAPTAAASPAKPGLPIVTIAIVAGALAAGAALGALLIGPKLARAKATAPVAAAAENKPKPSGGHGKEGKEKSSVYRVENLIVNPSGSEGSHFLMASVAIRVEDDKQEDVLRSHDDEVRDRIIGVLEKQTLESLSAPGARDTLRVRIAAALAPLGGGGDPSHIFLPNFVIQ